MKRLPLIDPRIASAVRGFFINEHKHIQEAVQDEVSEEELSKLILEQAAETIHTEMSNYESSALTPNAKSMIRVNSDSQLVRNGELVTSKLAKDKTFSKHFSLREKLKDNRANYENTFN